MKPKIRTFGELAIGRRIVETKRTATPRYGMTVGGYTCNAGAPTSYMVRFEGENRWRRLMCWCFSNVGTCFVRIGGVPFVVHELDLP